VAGPSGAASDLRRPVVVDVIELFSPTLTFRQNKLTRLFAPTSFSSICLTRYNDSLQKIGKKLYQIVFTKLGFVLYLKAWLPVSH
jgi:hypothetical protein